MSPACPPSKSSSVADLFFGFFFLTKYEMAGRRRAVKECLEATSCESPSAGGRLRLCRHSIVGRRVNGSGTACVHVSCFSVVLSFALLTLVARFQ